MTTEAEAVAKLVQTPRAHLVKNEDGREFLVVPDDHTSQEITRPNSIETFLPDFITQSIAVQTADSLVEYVKDYKGDTTTLFADISSDTIIAQIDYHGKDSAAHCAHRATLTLSRSIEWKEWTAISDRLMPQLDFARFIEENAADVRAPDGASLLETIRDIQAHRKVNFSKAVRTSSECETFSYTEDTQAQAKGDVDIPTKFKLGIPVYFGEPDHELFAFLRWKLDPPNLLLGIKLHRPEHVRQAVFQEIVTRISERTECMAVFGKI